MAEAVPSTSLDTSVDSYYIKEPKMDIPLHRDTILPIKGQVIHDASEFMAAHLELNYVDVSHKFNILHVHSLRVLQNRYVTGALIRCTYGCL